MTSPLRIEILRELERLSEMTPDIRFGQLVANLTFLAAGPWEAALWDLEDNQLLAAIQQYQSDLARRQQVVA